LKKKKQLVKKLVSVVTMICVLLSAMNLSVTEAYAQISDIKGHWAEETLQKWVENNHLKGYGDGSIKPNESVTRAEFMALINRAFKFEEKAEVKAADVAPSKWYYDQVARALCGHSFSRSNEP
jgi:hypothetical protein